MELIYGKIYYVANSFIMVIYQCIQSSSEIKTQMLIPMPLNIVFTSSGTTSDDSFDMTNTSFCTPGTLLDAQSFQVKVCVLQSCSFNTLLYKFPFTMLPHYQRVPVFLAINLNTAPITQLCLGLKRVY